MRDKLLTYGPYVLSALILGGIAAAYFFIPDFRTTIQEGWKLIKSGEREAISDWFRSFGATGPLLILLFMFLQMITVVLPSFVLMVVCVIGYGPIWGSLLSIGGIVLVAAIAYWIGHALGERVLQRFVGEKTERKMHKFLDSYGLGAVAVFRLSPFLSNDAVSFVAGMLNMPFMKFILGTLLGIVPLTIAIAFFAQSLEQLKTGLIWIGIVGIVLYAIYVWVDRKKS